MSDSDAVFLYDGDCAFCSSCARVIERRIPTRARVEPWQRVDLDALGVSERAADASVQWVAADGTVSAGAAAISRLLRDAGSFWRWLGRLLGTRVGLAVADPIYHWVSRHRDLMPGGTAACALPAHR